MMRLSRGETLTSSLANQLQGLVWIKVKNVSGGQNGDRLYMEASGLIRELAAQTIFRMKGFKCGSPPFAFKGALSFS